MLGEKAVCATVFPHLYVLRNKQTNTAFPATLPATLLLQGFKKLEFVTS